jgi:drug/metabolite transporter (DMT)-like permease
MRYGTGVALVALAAVMWSTMGLLVRAIGPADAWTIVFWRSAGMVPVLLAVVALRQGAVLRPFADTGLPGVIGGLGLVAAFGGAITAFQITTVANAVFLFSASPFFAAVLGWLILREPVRGATWGAIGLAVAGMFLMVREGLGTGATAGNVAALISALGFATFTVALRRGRLGDMLPATVLGGVFSMIAGAAVILGTGGTLAAPLPVIGISVFMGAGTLAAGLVLYTLGSRVIPAAELTLLSMIEVLLAPLWVWLAFGEMASAGTFAGGAVVLAAVVLNALSGARRMPAAPPVA